VDAAASTTKVSTGQLQAGTYWVGSEQRIDLVLSNSQFKVNNIRPSSRLFFLFTSVPTHDSPPWYCDREYKTSKEPVPCSVLNMPRLVRRQPLRERVMAAINPMDFLLWLSEELETRDWDSASVGTQMGLAMNFVFLLARANSGSSTPSDDIFSDESSSGWLSFLVNSRLLGLLVYHVEANHTYFKGLSGGMGPHSFLFHQCLLHDYPNAQVPTLSG
jgi:hypothetical protein